MKKSILTLLLCFSAAIYGQEGIEISGSIVDENDQPLPGASVLVKGTSKGVATDFDGNYTIMVDDKTAVLSFSYVGYENTEIVVGEQTTINVKLAPSASALDEIVIVGYGTQKRSDVTGAVTSLSKERLSSFLLLMYCSLYRVPLLG